MNANFPFLKDKKVLLAISGGLDSVVLHSLFNALNINIHLAHCNFQLFKFQFLTFLINFLLRKLSLVKLNNFIVAYIHQ